MSAPETIESWQACPEGRIRQLVVRRQAAWRQEVRERRAVLGTGLAGLAGLAVQGYSYYRPQLHQPGGIACDEVRRLAEAYLAGELSASKNRRVRQHLAACHLCREALDRITQVAHRQHGTDARQRLIAEFGTVSPSEGSGSERPS